MNPKIMGRPRKNCKRCGREIVVGYPDREVGPYCGTMCYALEHTDNPEPKKEKPKGK